ncbi:MAG: hypothetical protein BGP20_07025 [Thiobacillus sp. 63-78]|uniref:DUF2523 family protein n=1 Tax=Thiobacillus sp. 63-78 TaxID=1895859 RepID=UPI00086B9699|nr:DUF2523 family protein [Thiobacillus sp. 63-78]MBN8764050.1 DUF2523 domain-containing protein [Thiobacillus sp.]ODU86729.1 MAG: hypothetical protein ABT21_14375 [Thiobacillus sp. SCN 65-179]OJZ15659.1 MAG: hypothetical protein BGP20_07025 [Thiobacillus sp. 63-78]
MGNLAVFLLGLVTPLVRKALVALGLGVISYAGLALIANQVRDAVIANYGAMSGSVLDLLNLLGAGQALGIILGGIIARAAFAAVSRIGVMSA